jgi:hypothetical protein
MSKCCLGSRHSFLFFVIEQLDISLVPTLEKRGLCELFFEWSLIYASPTSSSSACDLCKACMGVDQRESAILVSSAMRCTVICLQNFNKT